MPGPTNDTISNYHVQQDIYTVQNAPDANKLRQIRASGMTACDTHQSQLERDIFNRLSSQGITNGAIILVAQVGKYIFLAVVLPPYIFFYGIPKWLLESAPPLFNHMKKGGQFLFNGILDFTFMVASPFKTALKKLQQLQKKIKTSITNLANHIHASLSRFGKQVRDLANSLYQTLSALMRAPKNAYDKLAEQLAALRDQAFSALKSAQEALSSRRKKTKEIFESGFNKIAQPVKDFTAWLNRGAKRGSKAFERAMEKTAEYLAKVTKAVTDPIRGAYEATTERLQNVYQAVAQPLVAWMAPKLETAREKITYSLDAFAEKLKAFQQMLANALQPLKEISQGLLNLLAMPKKLIQLGDKMGLSIVRVYKNIQKMLKFIPQTVSKVQDQVKRFIKRVKEWKDKGLALAKKGFHWLLEKVKVVPRKAFEWLKIALNLLKKFFQWLIYCVSVLLAWISVLLKFGMQNVRRYGKLSDR